MDRQFTHTELAIIASALHGRAATVRSIAKAQLPFNRRDGIAEDCYADRLTELACKAEALSDLDPAEHNTSAAALIHDIAMTAACGESEPDTMAEALDSIVGRAQGWLRTHMGGPNA
jgi:hypothetical protein